ncbi:hypothetical protein ACFYUY_09150 [Kitasatospora sp. NPDC004745]|uniref:hypothetical protein n=1 Tax=Kitasatospora sp. NPDC004745 TaxID=3364019 RepID=UPI003687E602
MTAHENTNTGDEHVTVTVVAPGGDDLSLQVEGQAVEGPQELDQPAAMARRGLMDQGQS